MGIKIISEDGPHIINPKSNFVAVTFWWGRGKLNKNYQRPCPEKLEEGEDPKKKGITFDEMARIWSKQAKKINVNYYSMEIAGMKNTQAGLNFKPKAIRHALKKVNPRSVIFMDADITIRRYPHLFDLTHADYMAHLWNSDVRTFEIDAPKCWAPYTFEHSSGIEFFTNSSTARRILNNWINEMGKKINAGTADDRVGSLSFNDHHTMSWSNFIALPQEYLWLTLEYGDFGKVHGVKKSQIILEHPHCLTGEERAVVEGGAQGGTKGAGREPPRYEKVVSKIHRCIVPNAMGEKRLLNIEYLWLDTLAQAKSLRNYHEAISNANLITFVPFTKKWGSLNANVKKARKEMTSMKPKPLTEVAKKTPDSGERLIAMKQGGNRKVTFSVDPDHSLPLQFLKLKKLGYTRIIYLPKNANSAQKSKLMSQLNKFRKNNIEFSAKNKNKSRDRGHPFYFLKTTTTSPIYVSFESGNKMVPNFLMLWAVSKTSGKNNTDRLNNTFNSTLQAVSMMRSEWL